MKFKRIIAIATVLVFISCSKKDNGDVNINEKFTISGTVTAPSGVSLEGVVVAFDDGTNVYEITTDETGQYLFEESGNSTIDLKFNGNQIRYLNMRDRQVNFGGFNRTFDKMMVPWEIEEIDFLNTSFVDNNEKMFSLVHYNFEELKIRPSDFKNLTSSIHFDNYETTFTSIQNSEEKEVTVSFYSMPQDSGYTLDNNHTIPYSEVLGWEKILSISTNTTPIGVLEPVKVNLASAYANFPNYDHSGTIIIVSEGMNATLGVTSSVDILEIRLPYGDDF